MPVILPSWRGGHSPYPRFDAALFNDRVRKQMTFNRRSPGDFYVRSAVAKAEIGRHDRKDFPAPGLLPSSFAGA
jgi:hypothetical protein